MKPFSLSTKVFLWFWATLTVGSIVLLSVTLLTGSQPFGARWMRLTQDLYANSAVDFYTTGGPTSLQHYIDKLRLSGIHAELLDRAGRDVLSAEDRSTNRAVARTLRSGRSTLSPGRTWRAASVVDRNGTRFLFLAEVSPTSGFIDGIFGLPVLLRLLLAVGIAGIFSFVLARSLLRPIARLQSGARDLAGGKLDTRISPQIRTRHGELAETARAFDHMAEQLERMVRSRDQLLADISHELRSPLTRLSVAFELVRRGELDMLDRIDAELERMHAMIGRLLLLARLESSFDATEAPLLELTPLLRELAADAGFEGQTEAKRVQLDVSGEWQLRAEADLLRSCLENIVRNALRFSPAGGVVTLTVAEADEPGWVAIRVGDQGPGVPADTLPLLFEPFFQVSEERTPGTDAHIGLGLSIAQRAATVLGGSVTARNRTAEPGLVVTILLPAQRQL